MNQYMVFKKNYKMAQYLLIIWASIMFITGCTTDYSGKMPPVAVDGVLDLRDWDFEKDGPVDLAGAWEIYWEKLLDGRETGSSASIKPDGVFDIPGYWNAHVLPDSRVLGHLGFATFKLQVLLPNNLTDTVPASNLTILTRRGISSYSLRVFSSKGEILARTLKGGVVGETKESSIPLRRFDITSIPCASQWTLIYQVSNFHDFSGGPYFSPTIGTSTQLQSRLDNNRSLDFFTTGVLLVMGIYHLILFGLYSRDRSPGWFGVFCFLISIYSIVLNCYFQYSFPNLHIYGVYSRAFFVSLILSAPVFLFFIRSIFPARGRDRFFKTLVGALLLFGLYFLFFPLSSSITGSIYSLFLYCIVFTISWVLYVLIREIVKEGSPLAKVILSGFGIFAFTLIYDIVFALGFIRSTINLTPYGLLFFIIFQSAVIAIKNQAAHKQRLLAEKQAVQNLKKTEQIQANYSRELEEEVAERTLALNKSLVQVNEATKEIMASLRYAEMIQRSLLPSLDFFKAKIPESFVIWMPRDIVGGDIVFADFFENGTAGAVVDCTGHGVPGALMSMIASSGLRKIITDERCFDPAGILKKLNIFVKNSLQHNSKEILSDDGMDVALIYFDKEVQTITFAGARLPLIYVHDDRLTIIKGDKQSIGYRKSDLNFTYTNHTIEVEEGMTFYMYSDGITDQLGGEKGLMFGTIRLKKLLQEISKENFDRQQEIITETLKEYQGANNRQDDITVIGFKISKKNQDL